MADGIRMNFGDKKYNEHVHIDGLNDLVFRCNDLPRRIVRNMLLASLKAGAKVFVTEAKRRAPVGTVSHYINRKIRNPNKVRPGFMRKSIRVKPAPGKPGEVKIQIGVSGKAYYWRFVEFGTEKMAAQPFMRPAWELTKFKILEDVRVSLKERIEKEFAKRSGK